MVCKPLHKEVATPFIHRIERLNEELSDTLSLVFLRLAGRPRVDAFLY